MKLFKVLVGALIISLVSCKNDKQKTTNETIEKQEVSYLSFGDEISDSNVISKDEMAKKFKNLKHGDTIDVKFATAINEVCKSKGCWMNVDLGEESQDALVKFKDYGFFMPLNSDNKEIIVQGKAFIETTSVEELRHLAKDAGKSEEEIAKITEPKRSLSLVSDGVLMKK
jgi:hypothetical protein